MKYMQTRYEYHSRYNINIQVLNRTDLRFVEGCEGGAEDGAEVVASFYEFLVVLLRRIGVESLQLNLNVDLGG